jgi:DNA transformation protein and related proteins
MGIKGDKMSQSSEEVAKVMEVKLQAIEGISMKKMFGGFGLFQADKMFGILDSKGGVFVKGDKHLMEKYLTIGAEQHSRMPYFSITEREMHNETNFLNRVNEAIELSKSK